VGGAAAGAKGGRQDAELEAKAPTLRRPARRGGVAGQIEAGCGLRRVLRERGPVDLAVGRRGQPLEVDEDGGHPVLGQPGAEVAAQHHVGHDHPPARLSTHDEADGETDDRATRAWSRGHGLTQSSCGEDDPLLAADDR
jgi:hypothetical protein